MKKTVQIVTSVILLLIFSFSTEARTRPGQGRANNNRGAARACAPALTQAQRACGRDAQRSTSDSAGATVTARPTGARNAAALAATAQQNTGNAEVRAGRACQRAAQSCAQACRANRQSATQCRSLNRRGSNQVRQGRANQAGAAQSAQTANNASQGGSSMSSMLPLLAGLAGGALLASAMKGKESNAPSAQACTTIGAPDVGIQNRQVCDAATASALSQQISAERAKRSRTASPSPVVTVNPMTAPVDITTVKNFLNTSRAGDDLPSLDQKVAQVQTLISNRDICGAASSIRELEMEGSHDRARDLQGLLDQQLDRANQPPGEVGIALNCR